MGRISRSSVCAALTGAAAFTSVVVSSSPALAQVPPRNDEAPVVFRATTELIQFDAIVVGADGQPLTTLTTDDFEVLQDGEPVALRDVTFIDRSARLRDIVQRTDGTHAAPPRIGIDVDPLIFLIDDMVMTLDGFMRVKEGLRQFVRDLPEGIEVGILRTGETGRRDTALSADRDVLARRIDGMRYLARSVRGGMARSGVASPGHLDLDRTFVDGTFGSLNSLLVNLRALPGRKTVVVMSEGIALRLGSGMAGPAAIGSPTLGSDDGHWLTPPVEGRLHRLAQLAADAGVTAHAVDVSGVPGAAAGGLTRRINMRDGLTTIADRMGGQYFGLANDLAKPLARIADLERGYYLLSYVPPDGTFVEREPAPFRRLTVHVRDDRLQVLTRPGFFGRHRSKPGP